MTFTRWSRASRLSRQLNAATEGIIIIRKSRAGFAAQLDYQGKRVFVQLHQYVTVEHAKKKLLAAQREIERGNFVYERSAS